MKQFLSIIGVVTSSTLPPASLEAAAAQGDMKSLLDFLEIGAVGNPQDTRIPAVSNALRHHREDIYRYLRDFHGADVNHAVGSNAMTPLFYAIQSGNIELVREVLDDGGGLESARPNDDWTPLFAAIHHGNLEIFRELMYRGADVSAVNKRGFTPLMIAIRSGRREMALILIREGAEVNIEVDGDSPFRLAVASGMVDVATAIFDKGVDPSNLNWQDASPLGLAARTGSVEMVKMLVARGVDANRVVTTREGQFTPLVSAILAYQVDKIALMTVLISEGHADVNWTDNRGRTPLHRAAYGGIEGIAKFLIENGADVERTDSDGRTPREAARYQSKQISLAGFRNNRLNDKWISEFGH